MQNAKTVGRESHSLQDIAILACANTEISLLADKLYIIYRKLKVDMQLSHRQTVY